MNRGVVKGTFGRRDVGITGTVRSFREHAQQDIYGNSNSVPEPYGVPLRATLNAKGAVSTGLFGAGLSQAYLPPWTWQTGQVQGGAWPTDGSGPMGQLQLDGVIEWNSNAAALGTTPTAQFFVTNKNARGAAVNIGGSSGVGQSQTFLGDAAAVNFNTQGALPSPDMPGGFTGPSINGKLAWDFSAAPIFGTINAGTMTGPASSVGFVSIASIFGNVTSMTRVDFAAREIFRTTTSDGTPAPTTHVGFYVEPYAAATKNIGLWIDDGSAGITQPGASSTWGIYNQRAQYNGSTTQLQGEVTYVPNGATYTDGGVHSVSAVTSTINYTTTSGWTNQFLTYSPTIACTIAGNALGADLVFNNIATYTSATAVNIGPVQSFNSAYTKTIDTQTGRSINANVCYTSQPVFQTANNGSYNAGSHTGFSANPTFSGNATNPTTAVSETGFSYGLTINANTTVTTVTAYKISAPTVSGTLTNFFGLDIPAMTGAATSSVGIRCTPAIVYPPTVCTCTSNAATVPVSCSHAKVTNSSAATCTITLSTSGALDGQELRVRFFDASAVSQTVTFTNSETGKVGAPPVSLGSTTIPTTYRFIYNSGTSKWTYCSE